jgi:hypothetical protein
MTAPEVLAELERRGVTARVVGAVLRLAPATALDDALLTEARRLKPELIRLLSERGDVVTPAECGWCSAPLAPFQFNVGGRPSLLCSECKRWTLAGWPS